MSFRYWIIALALGLTLGASGQAQQGSAPAEEQSSRHEQPAQEFPLPIPVQIIEDEETADARRSRDDEVRQREIADLAAQEGMNEATQRMADYAFWSTVFVAVGTALLVVTLLLTLQANRAARRAVEVADTVGNAQLRAYVDFYDVLGHPWTNKAENHSGAPSGFIFLFYYRNFGQTPARNCAGAVQVAFADTIAEALVEIANSDEAFVTALPSLSGKQLSPTNSFVVHTDPIPVESIEAVIAGHTALLFRARVEYNDFNGHKRFSAVTFALRVICPPGYLRQMPFDPSVAFQFDAVGGDNTGT
jgi:hypothetical protein